MGSTWSGAVPPQSQRYRPFSLAAVELPVLPGLVVAAVELVALAAVAVAQLVVVAVAAEQALVVEAARVLPLVPALVLRQALPRALLRLPQPDRRQAPRRLCSLQQCRPLCI